MLFRNALVMYDRQTETFWSHFTGEALKGPLEGKTLSVIASAPRVTWKTWRDAHPNTLVLSVDGRTHEVRSSYESYAKDAGQMGMRPVQNRDNRLPGKSLVIGVLKGKRAFAYPVEEVVKRGVIMDGGLVIFADKDLGLYGAFEARKGLRFVALDGRSLVSSEGEKFHAITGKGAGASLKAVPVIRSYWFAWADHHPKTALWKP